MDTPILGHYIGGEWTGADGALESLNPSNTDEVVARFPDGGQAEVDAAVAAAKAAQPGWANASPEVRSDVLRKAGEALFARSAEVGELLAREEGKTRAEGIGETLRAARILLYFSGEALRRHGQTLESTRPGLDVATYREALGVVGLITPWNFPIAIPAWKAAPALAFGNTVVIKPANITSAIAVALTQVLHDAGIPPGVFNLRSGAAEVKIEVSPVTRGTVGSPQTMRVTGAVEDAFGFAEMSLVAFEDLYAGKLCAALDRQHPRDLFDVELLYENEGLTDDLFRTFLVYATCSKRPLHELIDPNMISIDRAFAQEFDGMTVEHVSLETLLAARERLVHDIQARVVGAAGEFLLSVHDGAPKFDLIGLPAAANLPAVRWKLINLERLMEKNPEKHAAQRAALEGAIAKG